MIRRLVDRAAALGDRVWVGAILLGIALLSLAQEPNTNDGRPFGIGSAVILAIGVAGLLALGRRWPGWVAVGVIGLTMLWYGLDHASPAINVVTLAAFYNLGVVADRGRAIAVLVASASLVLTAMVLVGDETLADAGGALAWLTSALLLGLLVHQRRLLVEEYRRRAEDAEANREAVAQQRADQVRVEIARDLHDLLAHTVSVMTVQAGVAADAIDDDPVAARRALDEIRRAGRDATAEVGGLVRVLRDRGADRSPAPTLDQLTDLTASVGAGGPHVHLAVDVGPDRPSDAVALTVYRIVQEALTNVLRHSAATTVDVTVRRDADALLVRVHDDAPADARSLGGDASPSAGVGLVGMRERVEGLDGRLRAGPDPSGGWTVEARVPVTGSPT